MLKCYAKYFNIIVFYHLIIHVYSKIFFSARSFCRPGKEKEKQIETNIYINEEFDTW